MGRACPSGSVQWVASDRRQSDDHVAVALAFAAHGGEPVNDAHIEPDQPVALGGLPSTCPSLTQANMARRLEKLALELGFGEAC